MAFFTPAPGDNLLSYATDRLEILVPFAFYTSSAAFILELKYSDSRRIRIHFAPD